MRTRTLIGLMFCTLFLSAPAFAQPNTAQPVIQTAQAVQNDVTIPEGTTQVFDAANGEIAFDGVLTNKGTIIIRSSDPAQAEVILHASKVVNEGKIVSEVPTLTINAESVTGTGEVAAPETIAIVGASKDLQILSGVYRAKFFRPSTDGKLTINARRIDAQIDLKAFELSIGVREGNLNIIKQKLDGDPIYYNRGGDVSVAIPSSNGQDIYVLAAGNVTLSGVDASGGENGEVGDLVVSAGLHFANPANDGGDVMQCGEFGASCYQTIQNHSGPGQIFEGAPGGPFPPSGTITINGAKAKVIWLIARDVVLNGTIEAVPDNRPAAPAILVDAANSLTATGTLKANPNTADPTNYSAISLNAPTINVGKLIAGHVEIAAFENSVASTGSIKTGAIEAETYIDINGGHIQFGEAGGGLLPLSQPHDSGEFTIKTGKLTAHRFINLAATGNIDAGNIELLPNEAEVPLGSHDVRIHANVGKEDAPALKIGGGTNGAASITLHGTTDLGEGLTQKTGAIFLTNGPSGDIVIDGAKLHVTSEHEGTPSLIAYAGTGQVTVKGNIVLDGTSSAPAGQILLVGDEIRSTGASLSAKDTLAAAADNPAKVVLATSKLTLAGDLTIEANSKAQTSVKVVPKGSITLNPQDNFPSIPVTVDKFPISVTEGEVLVAGGGNLTIKTKSDQAKVEITAKPLKFNNGTSQIFATGDGSQINIDYPGAASGVNSLVFSGGAVALNTDNDQSAAGDISITADGVKGNQGSALNLLARGKATFNGGHVTVNAAKVILEDSGNSIDVSSIGTSGEGGSINLTTTGNLTIAGSLKSNGKDTGEGGSVDLQSSHNIDISMASFSADGGCNSGDGGSVTLNASNRLNGSGAATAKGGGTCSTLLSQRQSSLSPHVVGSGNGGTITVFGRIEDDFFTGPLTGLSVDALGGDGNGGKIIIFNSNPVDISHLIGPDAITARGVGNGKGGLVAISRVSEEPNSIGIDKVIAVSGGDSLLTTPESDFGRIILNGVVCQQRTTGQTSWPKAYWNCAHPDSSTAYEIAMPGAAVNLPPAFKTTLDSNGVSLYVFSQTDDYNTFAADAAPVPTVGYSTDMRHLALVSEATGSGVDYAPYLRGNLMHEVGHLLDAYTIPHPSGSNAWLTKLDATQSAMLGTWPTSPPNPTPTCTDVFNQATLCNVEPNTSPWQILLDQYVQGQVVQTEVFAIAFQNCSGYELENTGAGFGLGLQNASRSIYMRDVYNYMDQVFWPGGCPQRP